MENNSTILQFYTSHVSSIYPKLSREFNQVLALGNRTNPGDPQRKRSTLVWGKMFFSIFLMDNNIHGWGGSWIWQMLKRFWMREQKESRWTWRGWWNGLVWKDHLIRDTSLQTRFFQAPLTWPWVRDEAEICQVPPSPLSQFLTFDLPFLEIKTQISPLSDHQVISCSPPLLGGWKSALGCSVQPAKAGKAWQLPSVQPWWKIVPRGVRLWCNYLFLSPTCASGCHWNLASVSYI